MTIIPERLHENLTDAPERVAIYLQDSHKPDLAISNRQLMRGAYAYAQTYLHKGINPGEVIILILQHGEDLIYSYWGASLIGAIPSIMPFLTEKLTPERYRVDLATLLSITKPAAIVTYPEFEGEINAALSPGSSVRAVIVTNDHEKQTEPDLTKLPGMTRKEDDIALLQHSSGTTGLQKGVALSHKAIFNQLNAYGNALTLNQEDVVVSWLPLYHDMGLIAGFMMPILSGIPLVLSSPFDWVRAPHRLLQAVSKYKGTLSWLPNFAYNFCAQKVRDSNLEGLDLTSWRAIINCSEPVHWESHQVFYERFKSYGLKLEALQTSYAMAENVFGVTQSDLSHPPKVEEIDREIFMSKRKAHSPLKDHPVLKMMSSGKPLLNTRIRILDEEKKEVPDGNVGEIALQSECMLTGYFNRPDATEKALFDGWFLTGDYGYISDGEVFVSGRKKDMIIVGGRNVYPQDLESLSYEVPGVHAGRSVAFGVFNPEAGTEDVVIVVEADPKDADEQEEIADNIRQHITQNSAIALRYVKVVDPKWIIKTSSGKTARSANKEKFLKELGLQDNHIKNPS
jgi:fatty-acyl-CoA synthase